MTPDESKRFRAYVSAFKSLAAQSLRETFFRSIDAQYQHSPLSAVGSIAGGGRYNHIGDFEALYLADNLQTALFEVGSLARTADGTIKGKKMPPRVDLSVDVDLQRAVDLRNASALSSLAIAAEDLMLPWRLAQERGEYPVTQLLGAAAREAEIEALLVPSAKLKDASNVVLIVDRMTLKSSYSLFLGDSKALPAARFFGTYNPAETALLKTIFGERIE